VSYPFSQEKKLAERVVESKNQPPFLKKERWWSKAISAICKPPASKKTYRKRKSPVLETLEPRVLLSSDLAFGLDVNDLTLRYDDTLDAFQLINQDLDALDPGFVVSQAARDLTEALPTIQIDGSSGDDRLRLDLETLGLNQQITFNGTGSDTLITVADADFSLADSVGGASLGVIGQFFDLSGFDNIELKGGANDNTLDAKNYSGQLTLSGEGGNDTLLAGNGVARLLGGEGEDSLQAGDTNNQWSLSGLGAGGVNDAIFQDMENLIGGTGADDFVVSSEGGLNGNLSGGEGEDHVQAADQNNVWEINASNAGSLNGLDFDNIENLLGGSANDEFVISETGDISGTLSGGEGNDTLQGADQSNIWGITGSNAGNLNGLDFDSIENLQGGSEEDTFNFYALILTVSKIYKAEVKTIHLISTMVAVLAVVSMVVLVLIRLTMRIKPLL